VHQGSLIDGSAAPDHCFTADAQNPAKQAAPGRVAITLHTALLITLATSVHQCLRSGCDRTGRTISCLA